MASKTKKIGIGTGIVTIIALFGWLMANPDFNTQVSGDSYCKGDSLDPCFIYFNATFNPINPIYKYDYITNPSKIALNFTPEIEAYELCRPDKRCKHCGICPEGYRDLHLDQPFISGVLYSFRFEKGVKNEFLVVGYKKNVTDTVKWTLNALGEEFDPVWYPRLTEIQNCKNVSYEIITPIMGTCNHTYETSDCKDELITLTAKNGTVSCIKTEYYDCQIGEKITTETKEICEKTGYDFEGTIISEKVTCNLITGYCDTLTDGNGDGIKQSGESGCNLFENTCKFDVKGIEIIKNKIETSTGIVNLK